MSANSEKESSSTSPTVEGAPITLSHVLALPELVQAHVELISDRNILDIPIRWAHVVESPRAGQLIGGGELLLTTGVGLADNESELAQQIDQFAQAGATALLVELGQRWKKLPRIVRSRCIAHGLPLLVAHREIRFITVTEFIHTQIMHDHLDRLSAMRDVTESFWVLVHNGAPPEQLVKHTARLLGCPVILEDLSHRAILYAEGHELPSRLLADWHNRSRLLTAQRPENSVIAEPIRVTDPDDPDLTWDFVDIEARGTHWGRLYSKGNATETIDASHVLRHAAMALALERLGSATPHSWNDLADRLALRRLVNTELTTVGGEIEVLAAAGFTMKNRGSYAISLRFGTGENFTQKVRDFLRQHFPESTILVARAVRHPSHISCAISVPSSISGTQLAHTLKAFKPAATIVLSEKVTEPMSLARALTKVDLASFTTPTDVTKVKVINGNRLDGLIHDLRTDTSIQSFSQTTLEPLLDYDQRHGGDLMKCLQALLDFPTSRSAAATALHLSRTALYSRIAMIERLLEVELNDGTAVFKLNLAMRTLN